jgi:hypothetical protein
MKSFIIVLKRVGRIKNSGMQNKTAREMSQLFETNFKGEGRKDLLKGIYKPVGKGCVGSA